MAIAKESLHAFNALEQAKTQKYFREVDLMGFTEITISKVLSKGWRKGDKITIESDGISKDYKITSVEREDEKYSTTLKLEMILE